MEMRVDGDRTERRLCAVPMNVATATHRAQRGSPRVSQAPTASASVRTIVTVATIRFPNSMYEW